VECVDKSNAHVNKGGWNHFRIIQKITEQRAWKAGHRGTTGSGHIGHCTHAAEGSNEGYKALLM